MTSRLAERKNVHSSSLLVGGYRLLMVHSSARVSICLLLSTRKSTSNTNVFLCYEMGIRCILSIVSIRNDLKSSSWNAHRSLCLERDISTGCSVNS